MLSEPSLSLIEGALDPGRDVSGTAGQLTLDAAGRDHRGAADAGAGGVPWRHQRRAADRPGAGGGGLVPAARPRHRPGEPCGAARSRRSRPRGGVRRRRPVAHGGLVHQPVPGAARCGRARSRRGAGGRACARARAQARSRSSCGRCRTTGWAMGCCAISTRRPPRSLPGFAAPQIGFNYLGRFGGAAPASAADWGGAPEAVTLGQRRRSGDAAGARARGQCAHARWCGGGAS